MLHRPRGRGWRCGCRPMAHTGCSDPFIVVHQTAMTKIALVPICYIWLGEPGLENLRDGESRSSVFITILMTLHGLPRRRSDKVKVVRVWGALAPAE